MCNRCDTCKVVIPETGQTGHPLRFCGQHCKQYHTNHVKPFKAAAEALLDMQFCLEQGEEGLRMWANTYARDSKGAPRQKVLETLFGKATGLTPITSLITQAIANHPDNNLLKTFACKFNAWSNNSIRKLCVTCEINYPSFDSKRTKKWRKYCSDKCCNMSKRNGGSTRTTIDTTMLEKYGVKGGFTAERLSKMADEREKRTGYRCSMQNPVTVQKAMETRKANGTDKSSKPELEIKEFIQTLGFKCEHGNWSLLKGKQIDIYVPERRLAVEYNGCFFHSEGNGGEDYAKRRHVEKTEACESKGVHLLHIWEDEWQTDKTKVLNLIKRKLGVLHDKIFARNTNLVIEPNAQKLYNAHHIQGHGAGSVVYGLEHKCELVAAMSFVRRKDYWELNRYAAKNVLGGFSKLLRAFQRLNPGWGRLISFGDRCVVYRHDNVYLKNGFVETAVNKPDYKYTSGKCDRIHKFNFRKQILSRRYGLPLSMTEHEMARELGYKRIYNSGLLKYELKEKETI